MNALVCCHLRLILPLNLLVVLKRLALCPGNLVLSLLERSDTLILRALVLLAVPLLISDIARLVLSAHHKDLVTKLDGMSLAAVDTATGNTELGRVLADELLGAGRPLVVTGRNHLLDEGHALLGNSLDGLAVHGSLGDALELAEGGAVQVEEGRSGRGMCPETGEAGGSTGLQVARKHTSCRPHPGEVNCNCFVVSYELMEWSEEIELTSLDSCLTIADPAGTCILT